MRVVVLADTHVGAHGRPALPEGVLDALDTCDVVLHAGDLVDTRLLRTLEEHAPVHAVLGNNDRGGLALPETLTLDLAAVQVAMVHDSGRTSGRAARLRHRFPTADLVVFGHSHVPVLARIDDGPLLLNPGSPTYRRSQPVATFATLVLADGRVTSCEVRAAATGEPLDLPLG